MSAGSWGTGGATPGPEGVVGRPGDGLRKVLSVIEPELDVLSSPPLERPLEAFAGDPEALDDRLCIRLVWTSATGVGGGDIARRAAAAAEADRFP